MVKTAAQALAANIRARRALLGLSQVDLADAMRSLGHRWNRATVANVESNVRLVSTDELVSLALVLDALVGELLDPGEEDLDYGGPEPLRAVLGQLWTRSGVRLRWRSGHLGMEGIPEGIAEYLKWRNHKGRELIDAILEPVLGAEEVDRQGEGRDASPPTPDPEEGS